MSTTALLKVTPSDRTREKLVADLLKSEQLPSFIKPTKPITVSNGTHTVTYFVSPDYVSLGTDSDFVRWPMRPLTPGSWLQKHGYTLPTRKMVDQIYHQADIKLKPVSYSAMYRLVSDKKKPGRSSTVAFFEHNRQIAKQLNLYGSEYNPNTTLVAGHKKDVVLSNEQSDALKHRNYMAIYGWHNEDGTVIQPLNAVSHTVDYVDYSHGFRIVSNNCTVDGALTTIQNVWSDHVLCSLLTDGEPQRFTFYGTL